MSKPSASPSSNDFAGGDTFRRVEVITGAGRRRKWSRRRKEAIVLETLEEGASVCEVARRHGVDASQVFKWRREVGLRSRPSNAEPVAFAPLLIGQQAHQPPEDSSLPSFGLIELDFGGARARIPVTASREVILAVIDGLSMRRR